MSENTENGQLKIASKEESVSGTTVEKKTVKKASKSNPVLKSLGQVMTETDTKERDLSWIGLTKHLLTLKAVQGGLQGKGCKGTYEHLEFVARKDKDGVHIVYLCHRENAVEKGNKVYRHYTIKGSAKPTWERVERKTF